MTMTAVYQPAVWAALSLLALLPRRTSGTSSGAQVDAADFTIDMSTSSVTKFTVEDGTVVPMSPAVGFRCAAIPLTAALGLEPGATIPAAQIVGHGPRFEDSIRDHVHHMDAFACSGDAKDYTGTSSCTDPFDVPECGPFIAVYDKGAEDYRYPDDVGMAIGAGTGVTWILLQTHYLMTEKPHDLRTMPSIGNSGFHLEFHVGGTPRPHNARFLGIMDEMMNVPADAEAHEYTVPSSKLQSFLAHDVAQYGNLTVFAAHLHAHDDCDGFYMHARDADAAAAAAWEEFGRIAPYGGYGPDQTVKNFGPDSAVGRRITLRGKEELRIKCTWRAPHPRLAYGTDNGQEMCGPILLYYPTDVTIPQKSIAYAGYSSGVGETSTDRQNTVSANLRSSNKFKQASAIVAAE